MIDTRALTVLALGFLLLSPTYSIAQEDSIAQDDDAVLLDKIKAADAELLQITEEIPEAQGDDLVILRTRFSELGAEQRRDLHALLDRVSAMSAAGDDVTLLQQQLRQLLGRSSRRLRSYILSSQEDMHEESLQRPTLTPSEAETFENRMAIDTDRLNHLFLSLITLTDWMPETGMDVDDEREFLETRLTARGHSLLEVVPLTEKRLAGSRAELRRSPNDHDLQARVFAEEERLDSNTAALLATIHMMKLSGLPIVDLEVRALELTGQLTPEALELDVATGLLSRELLRVKTYLIEKGPRILLRLLLVAVILATFWIAGRFARHVVKRTIARRQVVPSKLLENTLVALTGRIVMIVGIVVVLSQLGISIGPLLAGLGIVGFIVGFALQDTLSNFASGVMILAYRPFDVGDMIEAAGVTGNVQFMNLVSTQILTPDNQTLIVPNSKIWGDVIRNVTARSRRRVDLVFGISYEDEIPKAERVLAEILDAHEKVLDEPEPVIKVHTLNDSSVDFVVRPWTRTEDYWDVHWDITRAVKMRFDLEGISIPYPQRDVHLSSTEADGGE